MGIAASPYRFNDKRLELRQTVIEEQFVRSLNCSIHKTALTEGFLKGAYRFLKNPKVTETALIASLQEQCRVNVEGKEVLAFCDTSSFNVDNHKKRISDFDGLGPIGENQHRQTWGFFIHPILVCEVRTGMTLGISDVQIFTWPNKTKKRKKSERFDRRDITIESKLSYRWLGPCIQSRDYSLAKAKHKTFIADREGDIMEVYDRLKDKNTDVLIRSQHNRQIETSMGERMNIKTFISSQKILSTKILKVESKKRKKRNAKVEIRIGNCKLLWPKTQATSYKNNKDGIEVSVIEVRESKHEGYSQEPPLLWRLISTKQIKTTEEALVEIGNYEQRWRIEEYFKLLKSDGYNIESSQLERGKSIRKLSLILMKTSIKVLQLKAARSGQGDIRVTDVFNEKEIACLNQLNRELSGNTEKQRNPYDSNHLGWASWIIARLGGWKGFYSGRPPGNKTFIWGLDKFESVMIGYLIFKNKDVS